MLNKRYAELDKLFSEFIRKRAMVESGGCQRCLTQKRDIVKDNGELYPAYKQLQCSHFIGRSRKSVRFDESNAIGVCGACHLYLTAHPLEHVEFFKNKLGERAFDLLQARARTSAKYLDKEAIGLYLKAKIEEILT